MNTLEQLKLYTTVVADTGDFNAIKDYKPTDATTNPSLILKAVQKDEYKPLFESIVRENKNSPISLIIDKLLTQFGQHILKIVSGRVSTEVDARLSFDTEATIEKGKTLIQMYADAGISRERILIKVASTWEGIRAAEVLQKQGIHCNMTLLFSPVQAAACAEAGAQLISPFVGRIYDWFKKVAGNEWNEEQHGGENDPGVLSVKQIFQYYKQHGIKTEIMGASFRNTSQIIALAGCDLLTISPELLKELYSSQTPVQRRLINDQSSQTNSNQRAQKIACDEKAFRWQLNEDAMATEKLAEGIRLFAADAIKLEKLIARIN